MEFSDKQVLITGGGSGLGADMALAFAQRGARVVISGRRQAALEAVAARHARILPIVTDVTDEASVQSLFATAGACQIVIANAGIAESSAFSKMSLEAWNRVMSVNATGVFLTLREGLRQMQPGGRLIVIASMLGLTGTAYTAHYTASKHAVVGLTRALAKEVARKGITVNALCPGYLDTEMTEGSIETIMRSTGMSAEKAKAMLAAHNPQDRLIPAAEVTSAALYLASESAASVNGQALSICGGAL
ncbi:MAG: SDR family oxidoreductase [Rhizobiales bacterium]|nr:SDR family oxidoreductase [Hyphomicrobiales bacterium]